MARPMVWLSKATAPFVWLLDQTSALIFRLLGLNRENKNMVTAEELHLVVAEAQNAGVLEESERAIISGIVRLADRPVREVMTPRTDIDWIDIGCSRDEIRAALAETPHSRIPGCRGFGRQYHWRDFDPRHAYRAARRAGDRPEDADPTGAGHPRPDGCDGCAGGAALGRGPAGAGP